MTGWGLIEPRSGLSSSGIYRRDLRAWALGLRESSPFNRDKSRIAPTKRKKGVWRELKAGTGSGYEVADFFRATLNFSNGEEGESLILPDENRWKHKRANGQS